jgi:uncharacterized protein
MKFEFDPVKDAINQTKYGLSFTAAKYIFEDVGLAILPSLREIDGEPRFKVIGHINGRLHTLVFVWRGTICRCISLRRSNDNEQKFYRNSGRPW